MQIIIDTSAIIAVLVNEPEKARLIELTRDTQLAAPHSVHWEIGNAFSAMFKKRLLTLEQARRTLLVYEQIPIQWLDTNLESALELAHAFNIYAYDAYILAAALKYRCPVLSLDRRLRQIATAAGAEMMEVD